jgi:serine phosphatase RsbU (regulator of sigma subunit)
MQKTIQEAILPTKSFIKAKYDDFFISFYPKDIVSGDFFWYAENEESSFIAAVDCTGHGVSGSIYVYDWICYTQSDRKGT